MASKTGKQYATGPRPVVARKKHTNVSKAWFYEDKHGLDIVVEPDRSSPYIRTSIVRLTKSLVLKAAKRRGWIK
jgi:hypothetical protein